MQCYKIVLVFIGLWYAKQITCTVLSFEIFFNSFGLRKENIDIYFAVVGYLFLFIENEYIIMLQCVKKKPVN